MQTIHTDIVIIGAGIAGLWLHHRLNDIGLHAILIDKSPIGGGQTLSSQGIIHGGTKYTLSGILSNAASAISAMPNRWLACLEGNGDIDLSGTQVLSQHQLMWSTQKLSSKLTSFFSSKALNGKIKSLDESQYPSTFKDSLFTGRLYQLNEPVLDVPSLIQQLSKKWKHRRLHTQGNYNFERDAQGNISSITLSDDIKIYSQEFILTSGEGNEALLNQLSLPSPKMQRRPLQMVLAKGHKLPKIYAHCVGASTKPIATITTHQHSDGDNVWYIGGNIAEDGVNIDSDELIQRTQETLRTILPWIDISGTTWATHSVNRAEPANKKLLRPDTAFVESVHNIHIAWPTKLALTPNLSDTVLEHIKKRKQSKKHIEDLDNIDQQLKALPASFTSQMASSLWERTFHAD